MADIARCLPDQAEHALSTVLDAFVVDPLLRWVWPSDERYAACAPVFFGALLDLRLASGEVWVADGGDAVWLVRDGSAVRQPVRVGVQGEDLVEVLSGLSTGDRVVVSGADKVSAGQDVS